MSLNTQDELANESSQYSKSQFLGICQDGMADTQRHSVSSSLSNSELDKLPCDDYHHDESVGRKVG